MAAAIFFYIWLKKLSTKKLFSIALEDKIL